MRDFAEFVKSEQRTVDPKVEGSSPFGLAYRLLQGSGRRFRRHLWQASRVFSGKFPLDLAFFSCIAR
jgi:hypothetical protein